VTRQKLDLQFVVTLHGDATFGKRSLQTSLKSNFIYRLGWLMAKLKDHHQLGLGDKGGEEAAHLDKRSFRCMSY
jgi:hypothetical protein